MPRVNLIPREERLRGRRRQAFIFPVAGAAVLALALGGSYFYFDRQLGQKEKDFESYKSKNASIAKQVSELQRYEDLKAQKTRLLSQITTIYGQRERWSRIMDDLAFVIPADLSLIKINAQVPGAQAVAGSSKASKTAAAGDMIIEGYTKEMNTIAILMVRIGLIPSLTDVTLISAETEYESGIERIHFKVAASLKSPGSPMAIIAPITGEEGPSDVTPTTPTGTTGTTATNRAPQTTPPSGGGVTP